MLKRSYINRRFIERLEKIIKAEEQKIISLILSGVIPEDWLEKILPIIGRQSIVRRKVSEGSLTSDDLNNLAAAKLDFLSFAVRQKIEAEQRFETIYERMFVRSLYYELVYLFNQTPDKLKNADNLTEFFNLFEGRKTTLSQYYFEALFAQCLKEGRADIALVLARLSRDFSLINRLFCQCISRNWLDDAFDIYLLNKKEYHLVVLFNSCRKQVRQDLIAKLEKE